MKTKSLLYILILQTLVSMQYATAQNDISGIEITPLIYTNQTKIPEDARDIIIDKLGNLLLSNGVISSNNSPLIMTPKVNEVEKSVQGAPSMFIVSLEINFYIGNQEDGKLFSNKMISVKGVGKSWGQAYIDAFQQIKGNDKDLIALINDAKQKIINYYEQQCSNIIAVSNSLANRNQYEAALYKLTSVPVACKTCYPKAIALSNDIFSKKIDFECKTKLMQATNAWNANQHYEGAVGAGEILNTINPGAKCFPDVLKLTSSIQKRVYEVDKREWNFEYDKEIGLEKNRIEAIKEIGKAYGNGQPKNVNINNKYWW